MLNKSDDGVHSCLTFDFKWNAFKMYYKMLLILSMMLALITDYASGFHRLYLYYHSGKNIF